MMICGKIIQGGLDLAADRPEIDPGRMKSFHDAFRFMSEEFPAMLARWDAQKEEP